MCVRKSAVRPLEIKTFRSSVRHGTATASAKPINWAFALTRLLSKVEVVFDSDEPRIHYFLDAPQFFRKQAIMRIET
jgi:hypothetical protein